MNKTKIFKSIAAVSLLVLTSLATAHHAIVAEYGGSSQPLLPLEGEVIKVRWVAPHVELRIKVTGGEYPVGEEWIINSHAPGLLARTYGIMPGEVKVGDNVRFVGWRSRFNVPRFHMRAISINGGPLRSTLRGADLRDVREGTLGDIVLAPGLDSDQPLQPEEE